MSGERVAAGIGGIMGTAYMVLGFLQLIAIVAGVWEFLGSGFFAGFFGIILALIITYIPILSQLTAFYGATESWGWDFWPAVVVFWGPWLVWVVVFFIVSAADARRG